MMYYISSGNMTLVKSIFLYLLMNFKTRLNAGYCFINFRFPGDAMEFKLHFTGHMFCEAKAEESTQVLWRPTQGFASQIDRVKHAYVTQSKLPAQFKPTMIRNGKAVTFPEVWEKKVHIRRKMKIHKYRKSMSNN